MAVGGIVGLILDNLLPGTPEERGLIAWRQQLSLKGGEEIKTASFHVFDLPFGLNRLSSKGFAKYVPFLPYYDPKEHEGVSMVVESESEKRCEEGVAMDLWCCGVVVFYTLMAKEAIF